MIYLYGLLAPEAPDATSLVSELSGVTGPVLACKMPEGQLIYGPHEGGQILAKRRFLLAHARVLEAVLPLGTILPMRFGMSAESLEDVGDLLQGQRSALALQMTRLAGLVEYGLTIDFDRDTALAHQLDRHEALSRERARLLAQPKPNHFEQAEFGRRLSEALDQHRTATQRQLSKALREHVTDLSLRAPDKDVQVIAADLLLPRDRAEALPELVATLLEDMDFGGGSEPAIRFVGPEPPYTFTRITLRAADKAA